MQHFVWLLMIAMLCLSSASRAQDGSEIFQHAPKVFECSGGVVGDQETAIHIAEAILFPVYGEDSIREQGPYQVTWNDGRWIVEGTVPDSGGWRFRVVILQLDGRILEIGSAG